MFFRDGYEVAKMSKFQSESLTASGGVIPFLSSRLLNQYWKIAPAHPIVEANYEANDH
jgi:hypothetical protein